MFSWALFLKRFQHSLHGIQQSQRSSLGKYKYRSSSSNGDNKREFDSFLRSTSCCGIVVVGSTLGIWYSSDNSLPSFADYANTEDNHHFQQHQYDHPPNKSSFFLFNDSYRRRVFFKYEKRIRLQSPPEKVFEYFASVGRRGSGEALMTPADLMRAVVAVFPPSGSNRVREGFLRGDQNNPAHLTCPPSHFFMLFDTNNDALISFSEYLFFVTLLSIPDSGFEVAFKMFDLDNNGEIDKEEFNKVMTLMRTQNRQVANYHRDGQVSPVEDGGLLEYFFGKDGKECLKLERFRQFLKDLHHEILRLEFSHYDYNNKGSITARDFGLSLVASADINHISKLLDIVDEIENDPSVRDIRITFQEFKAFAELRKKLQSFSLALFSYGKINGALTKSDFQRAASQVCGVTITDNVVDIIFRVFDANQDGDLSADEFVRVIQKREGDSSRVGCRSIISCWFNCASNCSSSKLRF